MVGVSVGGITLGLRPAPKPRDGHVYPVGVTSEITQPVRPVAEIWFVGRQSPASTRVRRPPIETPVTPGTRPAGGMAHGTRLLRVLHTPPFRPMDVGRSCDRRRDDLCLQPLDHGRARRPVGFEPTNPLSRVGDREPSCSGPPGPPPHAHVTTRSCHGRGIHPSRAYPPRIVEPWSGWVTLDRRPAPDAATGVTPGLDFITRR